MCDATGEEILITSSAVCLMHVLLVLRLSSRLGPSLLELLVTPFHVKVLHGNNVYRVASNAAGVSLRASTLSVHGRIGCRLQQGE